MLGKSAKPVIEILTGSLVSGGNQAQSPGGIKKPYDFGGVGLGIVAALEKSARIPPNTALFSRNLGGSGPIAARIIDLYCDGAEGGRKGDDRVPFRIQNANRGSVFHISPPRLGAEATGIPAPDFLSSCHLCRKKLQGKDIYMYRGEKAFCSPECRYRQMVVDERTEKCSSEASEVAVSGAGVGVGSPYANEQMHATGILAI